GKQYGNQQFKRRTEIKLGGGMRIVLTQASEDLQAFCFVHQTFPVSPFGNARSAAASVRRFFILSSIRYFPASISPRPINAPGGSIASRKGESVWKISTRNTFAQLPNSTSAPSNNVPLPIISRSEPSTNMAQVAPRPIEKPSSAESAGPFLAAKASARPTTIQLVTISGIKIPND